VAPAESHGVWIGLMHLGRDGAGWLAEGIRAARADGSLRTAALRDLLNRVLAGGHPVRVVYGRGGWVNVNDVAGLVDASGL
jgi:phosphoenolpyruvate phosphomutase